MTQPRVVFILGLLFPDPVFHQIAHYAAEVHRRQPAAYTLDAQSLPHLSLLHFEDVPENAEKIWQQIQDQSVQQMVQALKFKFSGIHFGITEGGFWLGLRVFERQPLIELQAAIIKKLGLRTYRNGVGDQFDPHSTLGGWDTLAELPTLRPASDLFNAEVVGMFLGLAIAGPKGQFRQLIFSQKD